MKKALTVKELIEVLKKFDENSLCIVTYDKDTETRHYPILLSCIEDITYINLVYNPYIEKIDTSATAFVQLCYII